MTGIETSASEIADQLGDCDEYGEADMLTALAKVNANANAKANASMLVDGTSPLGSMVGPSDGTLADAAVSPHSSGHSGLIAGIIILVLLLAGFIVFFLWYKRAHETDGVGGIPTSAMLTKASFKRTSDPNASAATNQMYMANDASMDSGAATNQMYMANNTSMDAGAVTNQMYMASGSEVDKTGTINSMNSQIYAIPLEGGDSHYA